MKFELKSYKLRKTKNYFKKKPILLIFNVSNSNSKNRQQMERLFHEHHLKCTKTYNTLSRKSLERSIFENIIVVMDGSICLVYFSENADFAVDLQKVIKVSPTMPFLGLKFNNKIYSSTQLKTISSLNYGKTVRVFNNSLKRLLKIPYYKLRKR